MTQRRGAGHGKIELQQVAGKTAITHCRANSPLKLLTPKSPGSNAWIFSSTYGGGLVGGDEIQLDVAAGPGTRSLLTTQASTKVYRSEKLVCRQTLNVRADTGSVVASIPDPIVCFTGARFEQRQQFDLAGDAGIMMLDWFTSGRKACGERWAFEKYRSHTEIVVDGKIVFRDVLLLDPVDGLIAGPMRMGRVDCFATAVVMGPQLASISEHVLKYIAQQPARGGGSVICSASPLSGGVVVRAAGVEVEDVSRWMKRLFSDVERVLGQDPWMRKV